MPKRGQKVEKGEPLFLVKQGSQSLMIPSPVSGKVASVNTELINHIEYVKMKPYELGWMCTLEPANLTGDLHTLKIGADAVSWYQEEIDKFSEMMKKISPQKQPTEASTEGKGELEQERMDDQTWKAFSKLFLRAS